MYRSIVIAFFLTCYYPALAQTSFYSFGSGTLVAGDSIRTKAIEFFLPVTDHERFGEIWIEELEDAADDVADFNTLAIATGLEMAEESRGAIRLYSMLTDLHDSVRIQIAFKDTSGFLDRSRGLEYIPLESGAKKLIIRMYYSYRMQDLSVLEDKMEEAEEQVDDLRDEISDKERSILGKQQDVEEKKNEISVHRQTLDAIVDELGQQRQVVARLTSEQERERNEVNREIRRLDSKKDGLQDDVRELNEEIFELGEEINDLKYELSEDRVTLNVAEAQLQTARDAFNRLRTEVQSYRVD